MNEYGKTNGKSDRGNVGSEYAEPYGQDRITVIDSTNDAAPETGNSGAEVIFAVMSISVAVAYASRKKKQ